MGSGAGGGGEEGSGRLIVANLGFEDELRAAAADAPAGPGTGGLSGAARRTAAAAGTLLRAFAGDGDRLWLPAPVDPHRLGRSGPLDPLPVPALETGPLDERPPAPRVLAWGESPAVARLRARGAGKAAERGKGTEGSGGSVSAARARKDGGEPPLHEAVWHLEPAPPQVVIRVAHRGFCLDLADELGLVLPGARRVAGPEELEEHLRTGGAAAGQGAWVVKAPYSAAGRERLLGTGLGPLRPSRKRRRLEGLFTRHGSLLFEPWVRRVADFGCTGLLTGTTVRLAGIHRLEVDERGTFRGIALHRKTEEGMDAHDLAGEEQDALEATFHAVAARLQATGYTGPLGLDAYRWRTPDGATRFHPLGELNPRLTFGLVARALAGRLAAADAVPEDGTRQWPQAPPGDGVRLVVGRRAPEGDSPLVHPGPDGAPGAWLTP